MSNVASWQNLYGVALRRGVNINLFDTSSAAASVDNDGALTDYGEKLFGAVTATEGAQAIMGIPSATYTLATDVYGVPVTNRPVFNPGQEVNEYQKAVGSPVATAGTGYNFSKGIIAPTTTYDFDFDRRTALPWLFAMFQRGASVSGTTKIVTVFDLPVATDDPTPDYFLSLFKTIDFPSGELISDAIPIRMTISGSEGEPLKLSFDVMGRQFSTHDFEADFGTSGLNPALGISNAGATAVNVAFAELAPYAWQDAMVCIADMTDDTVNEHMPVSATGFEVTVTANVTGVRYNSRTPVRYIIGGYTVEGKLSIPRASSDVGGSYLSARLVANSSVIHAIPINIFLDSATNTAPGTAISTVAMTAKQALATNGVAGDLHIQINALPKQAPTEDGDEAMINFAFSGVDTRSSNAVTTKAIAVSIVDGSGLNYNDRP